MAKDDIWMPFYIGDYLADTMTLTTEQHGAYILLIFAYWKNRGPLRDDNTQMAQITKLMLGAWRKHRPSMQKFFHVSGGFWRHKRIDALMEQQSKREKLNSDRAKRAAAARWENVNDDAPSIAQALHKQCPSKSESKSDRTLTVSLLGSGVEADFISGCAELLGQDAMSEFGGTWRKRFRAQPGKARRVMLALLEDLKNGKTVKRPGGYANDLWKRFAD